MMKFLFSAMLVMAPLAAANGADRGCYLKGKDATYPSETKLCVKHTGSQTSARYYICKDGTWVVFSESMQVDDPRCLQGLQGAGTQSGDPFK